MFDHMKYCSILAVMLLLALPCPMSAQTEINVGKNQNQLPSPGQICGEYSRRLSGNNSGFCSGQETRVFLGFDLRYRRCRPGHDVQNRISEAFYRLWF